MVSGQLLPLELGHKGVESSCRKGWPRAGFFFFFFLRLVFFPSFFFFFYLSSPAASLLFRILLPEEFARGRMVELTATSRRKSKVMWFSRSLVYGCGSKVQPSCRWRGGLICLLLNLPECSCHARPHAFLNFFQISVCVRQWLRIHIISHPP